jgi:hypothetical protein
MLARVSGLTGGAQRFKLLDDFVFCGGQRSPELQLPRIDDSVRRQVVVLLLGEPSIRRHEEIEGAPREPCEACCDGRGCYGYLVVHAKKLHHETTWLYPPIGALQ